MTARTDEDLNRAVVRVAALAATRPDADLRAALARAADFADSYNRTIATEQVQALGRIGERMQAAAAAALGAGTEAERAEAARTLASAAAWAAAHGARLASIEGIRFEAVRDGHTALTGLPLLVVAAVVAEAPAVGEVALIATLDAAAEVQP